MSILELQNEPGTPGTQCSRAYVTHIKALEREWITFYAVDVDIGTPTEIVLPYVWAVLPDYRQLEYNFRQRALPNYIVGTDWEAMARANSLQASHLTPANPIVHTVPPPDRTAPVADTPVVVHTLLPASDPAPRWLSKRRRLTEDHYEDWLVRNDKARSHDGLITSANTGEPPVGIPLMGDRTSQ